MPGEPIQGLLGEAAVGGELATVFIIVIRDLLNLCDDFCCRYCIIIGRVSYNRVCENLPILLRHIQPPVRTELQRSWIVYILANKIAGGEADGLGK